MQSAKQTRWGILTVSLRNFLRNASMPSLGSIFQRFQAECLGESLPNRHTPYQGWTVGRFQEECLAESLRNLTRISAELLRNASMPSQSSILPTIPGRALRRSVAESIFALPRLEFRSISGRVLSRSVVES